MQKLLNCSFIFLASVGLCLAQNWVPDEDGLMTSNWVQTTILDIHFLKDGPMGKDWIYGKWLDSDSIMRYAAYREGGKWIPLQVTGRITGGGATSIIEYGDTLYLGGIFTGPILMGDSVPLPWVPIIKYHNDSMWYSSDQIHFLKDFAVKGDTLLVAASTTYYTPTDTFGPHLLTTDGVNWVDPYSVQLSKPNLGLGGPWNRVEIHNGSIYTINLPDAGEFTGVIKWDGQQWSAFGPGIYGTVSQVYDFNFYNDEIYIGGSFTKYEDSRNPGEHIARWNGSNWESVGGGSPSPVWSFFKHDNLLYCHIRDSVFGDANINYLAAWDGHQWCGTNVNYVGGDPPINFGFVNDTLWSFFKNPGIVNGTSLGYLNYFDGDYVKGPNAICSTLGLSLEESEQKPTIQVYPNPAKDVLNVELPLGNETYRYELYSMDGRLLQQGKLEKEENQIKISKCISGLCVLKVIGEREVVSSKLAVER